MNTDLLDMEAIAGSETNRKYITEDEFKKINKTFKIHLNHKAKEIEDLGNLVFHSKGKHELKVKQNDKLQEDVEKKRKLLSEIELELEDSYKRLLLLEKKVYVEDVISIDFINETSSFSQGDLRQVPIIKNKLIKLLDHYKNLESQSFTLQIEKN